MTRKMSFKSFAKRWLGDETGAVVADFAIMLPIFVMFLLSSVEMGFLSFRQTMLERGLDLAVRDLRLGLIPDPSHATVKEDICRYSGFLPDCEESLRLEMQPVNLRAYTSLESDVDCIDKSEDIEPVRSFIPGGANELMVLRACIQVAPIFPSVGLGDQIAKDGNGDVSLVSVTAFVNEP